MIRTIGIVSLSRGLLGEAFMEHELRLGLERLAAMGLRVKFLPHARMGLEHLKNHPEDRAADLLAAFRDPEIDLILCAIGGDDTYRLAPYLFRDGALERAVCKKPFLGFSDTTLNHLMLHKMGLPTFYGQAFLPDVCELDRDMLPYTRRYFYALIATGRIARVTPSACWYDSRSDFGPDQLGVPMPSHPNEGFVLLRGPARFRGKILGGCIDSLLDMFDPGRYADMPEICREYGLFPSDWRGKILLLESSEEKMPPETYRRALTYLKQAGVFDQVSGILVGQPMDRTWQAEYHRILLETVENPDLPILANVNIGHSAPRCILPFGVDAAVDAERQTIDFTYE